MSSVVNIHFENGIRTQFYQPYTLENLADMISAVLEISVKEVIRSYAVHYKENGRDVPIKSSSELSGYVLRSLGSNCDIFIVKTQTISDPQTTSGPQSTSQNYPIRIRFVDTGDATQLGPPYTVENIADLVSVVLEIPAGEYMKLCRTHINDSAQNKISIFRAQDLQPLINNRSGELNIFVQLKTPKTPGVEETKKVAQSKPQAATLTIDCLKRYNFTEADCAVSAQYDVRGGGTGREFCRNLISQGHEPWNKWYQVNSSSSWVLLDFRGNTKHIAGIGFTSANDCPYRDPNHATVQFIGQQGFTLELPLDFASQRWNTIKFLTKNESCHEYAKVQVTFYNKKGQHEIQLGEIILYYW